MTDHLERYRAAADACETQVFWHQQRSPAEVLASLAAKGLLRWPELQAARDEHAGGPGIHQVTEYFLVGSFVSWMVALGSLVLLGG